MKKDCEICKKLIAEKYKHARLWKVLTVLFFMLAVVFAVLYFSTGDVFRHTVNNNDVEIVNEGGGNNNNNVAINNK